MPCKPRPYRILEDVSDQRLRALVISQHSLIAVSLPESRAECAPESMTGELFRTRDESEEVRGLSQRLSEHVQMIRHETVRRHLDGLRVAGSQNLSINQFDVKRPSEDWLPVVGAEREEIPVQAAVIELA
jgi:hypothetical protein